MSNINYIEKIFLRLAKYKWLIFTGGIVFAIAFFFYARAIPRIYTSKATVFPLTAGNESSAASALGTLLGAGETPKSFSQEASINIVELAMSRNTIESVVLTRLPQFGNKRIAELLIESYNKYKKPFVPSIESADDTFTLKALGSFILRENYSAKIIKSGILEINFSNGNKDLLSPISYEIIEKVSQFYIDLKIKKAQRDYDFTVRKVDSLQAKLDSFDRLAVLMNNSTLFVPNSKIEYSIPKENLVNSKERVLLQKNGAANNREEALWRLQKATPIIATLDKPEPPFTSKKTSKLIYTLIGFTAGLIISIIVLCAPILLSYLKEETNKTIFGDPATSEEKTPPLSVS